MVVAKVPAEPEAGAAVVVVGVDAAADVESVVVVLVGVVRLAFEDEDEGG